MLQSRCCVSRQPELGAKRSSVSERSSPGSVSSSKKAWKSEQDLKPQSSMDDEVFSATTCQSSDQQELDALTSTPRVDQLREKFMTTGQQTNYTGTVDSTVPKRVSHHRHHTRPIAACNVGSIAVYKIVVGRLECSVVASY